jgi:hypothetical protein
MNVYRHNFVVECPNNGNKIGYSLTIETRDRIMVEQIVEKCNVRTGFHEDLAEAFHDWWGGRQTMVAYHHGVWITTTRGDA